MRRSAARFRAGVTYACGGSCPAALAGLEGEAAAEEAVCAARARADRGRLPVPVRGGESSRHDGGDEEGDCQGRAGVTKSSIAAAFAEPPVPRLSETDSCCMRSIDRDESEDESSLAMWEKMTVTGFVPMRARAPT